MNRRIQQLKQQAEAYVDSVDAGFGIEHYRELVDLKFAELIVQECCDIISPYTVRMNKVGEEFLNPIIEIKQNFGLK